MNYTAVLQECGNVRVVTALVHALDELLQDDLHLLEVDAAEQAIAFRLAAYLNPFFEDCHVDVEYNRMGHVPKRVAKHGQLDRVFPDIVVHTRGTNDNNILVIEIKKSSNREDKDLDLGKLTAYRQELRYQHALFIRFGVGRIAGTVTECEWI